MHDILQRKLTQNRPLSKELTIKISTEGQGEGRKAKICNQIRFKFRSVQVWQTKAKIEWNVKERGVTLLWEVVPGLRRSQDRERL